MESFFHEDTYIDIQQDIQIPAYSGALKASGFQPPGAEFADHALNLSALLPKDQASTFFMSLDSQDWQKAHLLHGDILVVDSSQNSAGNYALVVCNINGQRCLRRIRLFNSIPHLTVDHSKIKHERINIEDDFQVFGEVVGLYRSFKGINKIIF